MMDELLAKYMLGEATVTEIAAVDRWVFASDDNLKYFTHFKLIWEASRGLKPAHELDIAASWEEFKVLRQEPEQSGNASAVPAVKLLRPYQHWLRIAAVVVVMLSAGGLFYNYLKHDADALLTLQSFNSIKAQTLPDGSVITLNKMAAITYPKQFSGATREITLQKGEAFFAIAHNKSKPFIIHLPNALVKVVGTSFNINSSKAGAEVIVETGIVQVIHQEVTVRLQPQDKADIDYASGKITKGRSTDQLYKYYRTQELMADQTPLWKLVKTLNQIYKVNIEIADRATAERLITTKFRLDSLEKILYVIGETLNVRIVHQQKRIIISARQIR